jgi:hypothetical protein
MTPVNDVYAVLVSFTGVTDITDTAEEFLTSVDDSSEAILHQCQ